MLIKNLFDKKIDRRIEEVIKVDQTNEDVLRDEFDEYVMTDAIRTHYTQILDEYRQAPNKPHEGIAIWVSGFFGSGKSSFAKVLGLSVENRLIAGVHAADRLATQAGDRGQKLQVLLKAISEQIPTHTVIFDVSTDRGIRSGNQTLTEIMYGLFLQSLGYAKDLDLSELEIGLEERGQLERFEQEYRRLKQKEWKDEKGKVAFALSDASHVLHSLHPEIYPMADSWVKAVKDKADITPGKLAERATELMKRRGKTADGRVKSLMFVIDEVGQFVARDVQKMLDLQAVVQSLGVKGRGKHWIVITSQEKLSELVSGLDDKKIELARLMDRFPLQVHLEPSDISEVTSRRVLSKNAAAQAALGKLFDDNRSRLIDHTRMTADIKLPELTRDSFVDLYPLLPYQIDLIIQIVSGLRTQGGVSKHVGGANRTIIKLAQQLLINPAVNLADRPIGALVQLDQVYDLVEGNIGSEIRAKIASIAKEVEHRLAQPVAKVICLLQYAQSIHCTAENIAAALHPSVDADSVLAEVKEALRQLEAAHKVRKSDNGYRIPKPAEDDWERVRNSIGPKPSDAHRLLSEVLKEFWQPQPSHLLLDTKSFKAGLAIQGREIMTGDMLFNLSMADDAPAYKTLIKELRTRSQQEVKSVFWAVCLTDAIDHEIAEVFRSSEILSRKEREARTADESALIGDEKQRKSRHMDELRRLLKAACLSGNVYFRGNDRSPGDRATDVGKSAGEILGTVLPEVFDRFGEAAARSTDVKKGLEDLLTAANLQGLPAVFGRLSLLRSEKGKLVFLTETGPLAETLRLIEERANYGDIATGRTLVEKFATEPYGWEFDVVRLFVLSLLRAGKIEVTSKGQTIESATTSEASETFLNNNLFRQASFRPKKGPDFAELTKAASVYADVFGKDSRELNPSVLAGDIRKEATACEDLIGSALAQLNTHGLPGGAVLESALSQIKAISRGTDNNVIATFNASHQSIKEAIKRAGDLGQALTEPRMRDLDRAQRALAVAWPFLESEPDLSDTFRTQARQLGDLRARETFFRDLPAIDQHASALEAEYTRRFEVALQERINAYTRAHETLAKTPGWDGLQSDSQRQIAAPLQNGMKGVPQTIPIALLRSERDACEGRLRGAIRAVQEANDGERLATVDIGAYFEDGIETVEQLEAALTGLRDECARLIGEGKKVVAR
jgi:hypothetical protein